MDKYEEQFSNFMKWFDDLMKEALGDMYIDDKIPEIIEKQEMIKDPLKSCEVVSCNQLADDHHLITRGAGGCDCKVNILHLCRKHHRQIHDDKKGFLKLHPNIAVKWVRADIHKRLRRKGETACVPAWLNKNKFQE